MLGQDLLEALNTANTKLKETGQHDFTSLNEGVQAVLYKDKGKREELKNYRPITMLNSCYKVLATVMSVRTEKILDDLIDPDQTGFMSGRYICDNIRLLTDTLHHCNTEQIQGAIIMLDLEKAYR